MMPNHPPHKRTPAAGYLSLNPALDALPSLDLVQVETIHNLSDTDEEVEVLAETTTTNVVSTDRNGPLLQLMPTQFVCATNIRRRLIWNIHHLTGRYNIAANETIFLPLLRQPWVPIIS
jgi:hypothetical protein